MHSEISMAVDVFALGVVMMELLVGAPVPGNRRYPELTYVGVDVVNAITCDTNRPGAEQPEQIVDLVYKCMDNDPAARPKIGVVYQQLLDHITVV